MIEKTTELHELECALEAVLFAAGDSVSEGKLCAVLQTDKATLRNAAQNLGDYYDFNRRGIKLLRLDDRYQLASRADYAQMVRNTLETRKPQNLTPAALEVLAIIAYKQPVTKTYIEQVRGHLLVAQYPLSQTHLVHRVRVENIVDITAYGLEQYDQAVHLDT